VKCCDSHFKFHKVV